MTSTKSPKGVQSVEVAATILEALGAAGTFVPLKELASATGIDSSRTYTYLVSLVRTGLAEQDRDTGMYRLGPQVRKLGLVALNSLDLHRMAREAAIQLRDTIEETTAVAVWSLAGPVVVAWERGPHPLPVNINIGSILPLLGTAMGQVFLAHMSEADCKELAAAELKRLKQHDSYLNLRSLKDVKALAATVRTEGIARLGGALIPDAAALAAPIFSRDGKIAAAIGVIGSNICISDVHSTQAEQELIAATTSVSESLGYTSA